MRVLVTGAGGFLGSRLVRALLSDPAPSKFVESPLQITNLVALDKVRPDGPVHDPRAEFVQGDISDPDLLAQVFSTGYDLVFHLAAVVSGEAEHNFPLGRRVNLRATEAILEFCREMPNSPTFVFASSCAVFGGDFGDIVTDLTRTTPQSSYGTQKALGELLVNDYSRRGFIDGRSLRLPTICVRPGTANAATTSFVSGIIREPLAGRVQNCPVAPETRVWILSPNRVIENFVRAAKISSKLIGTNRLINLPGITVTIGDMVKSLESKCGESISDYITWDRDEFLQSIVLTFPHTFSTPLANKLGFSANKNFDEILDEYLREIEYSLNT